MNIFNIFINLIYHDFICVCINCTLYVYLQNGYPARRRSLVDDARFETLVVKQTKQSVLEEARQRANGESCESYSA